MRRRRRRRRSARARPTVQCRASGCGRTDRRPGSSCCCCCGCSSRAHACRCCSAEHDQECSATCPRRRWPGPDRKLGGGQEQKQRGCVGRPCTGAEDARYQRAAQVGDGQQTLCHLSAGRASARHLPMVGHAQGAPGLALESRSNASQAAPAAGKVQGVLTKVPRQERAREFGLGRSRGVRRPTSNSCACAAAGSAEPPAVWRQRRRWRRRRRRGTRTCATVDSAEPTAVWRWWRQCCSASARPVVMRHAVAKSRRKIWRTLYISSTINTSRSAFPESAKAGSAREGHNAK